MDIPRHLIIDLLPSYLADEISDSTRSVIEQALQQDDELRTLLNKNVILDDDVPINLTKDDEMKSFQRTKQLMNQQSLLMAVAFFLTLLPLSIRGGSEGIRWAWAEQPIVAGVSLVAAAILWIVYISLSRQLSRLD
ncbi:MAG: hypothetical protein IPH82_29745 [Chloroflexi bacterium]|nr:hypothetical protein [Chloroflexota bacterium]MBK7920342.1 hypothetical protein [Chloroflexota bacterium]